LNVLNGAQRLNGLNKVSAIAQAQKPIREDASFEKGLELGFDELPQGGPNQRILEQGSNPTTQDQRGCSTPFGFPSNFVPASRGGVYGKLTQARISGLGVPGGMALHGQALGHRLLLGIPQENARHRPLFLCESEN